MDEQKYQISCQKKEVDRVFKEICGYRFESIEKLTEWFVQQVGDIFPDLQIVDTPGINSEIDEEIIDVDYTMDGTLGKNILGMGYADFTISYIRDNGKRIYVTYADWNDSNL